MSIWGVASVFITGRRLAWAPPRTLKMAPDPLNIFTSSENHRQSPTTNVQVLSDYSVSLDTYQRKRGTPIDRPLFVSSRIMSLGKSTIDMQSDLTDNDGVWLGSCKTRFVVIDKITRKPTSVSKSLKDSLQEIVSGDRLEAMSPLRIPNSSSSVTALNVFSHSVRIRPSDMDWNSHTNHNSYIRLCTDVATVASKNGGHFKHFTGDICDYHVRRLRILYAGESSMGDLLLVRVWEKQGVDDTLCFVISKNLKPILHCSMQFFKNTKSQL